VKQPIILLLCLVGRGTRGYDQNIDAITKPNIKIPSSSHILILLCEYQHSRVPADPTFQAFLAPYLRIPEQTLALADHTSQVSLAAYLRIPTQPMPKLNTLPGIPRRLPENTGTAHAPADHPPRYPLPPT
jgi:hypothetical protein